MCFLIYGNGRQHETLLEDVYVDKQVYMWYSFASSHQYTGISYSYFLWTQVALKDVYLALIVIAITTVGGLIPVLGWAIPPLRATPSLQPDDLFKSTENVRGLLYSPIHSCIPKLGHANFIV